MDVKDGDIYPKYTFRLSHADKEWLERELDAMKSKFNFGNDGDWPVVTKNVLLMSALKRGLRFLRECVHSRVIQKNLELSAAPSRVWATLTGMLEPRLSPETVTAVVPNEAVHFTWREPTWRAAEETACGIRLRASESGGTRVEIVHSGWEMFPEAEAGALIKEFHARWEDTLTQLADILAKG